jgi:hypothetical protein
VAKKGTKELFPFRKMETILEGHHWMRYTGQKPVSLKEILEVLQFVPEDVMMGTIVNLISE